MREKCACSVDDSALVRCQNVLNGLQICGGTLEVKTGTKEQAILASLAAVSLSPLSLSLNLFLSPLVRENPSSNLRSLHTPSSPTSRGGYKCSLRCPFERIDPQTN
jgi:hypothetical protein